MEVSKQVPVEATKNRSSTVSDTRLQVEGIRLDVVTESHYPRVAGARPLAVPVRAWCSLATALKPARIFRVATSGSDLVGFGRLPPSLHWAALVDQVVHSQCRHELTDKLYLATIFELAVVVPSTEPIRSRLDGFLAWVRREARRGSIRLPEFLCKPTRPLRVTVGQRAHGIGIGPG